mmetsp:Transcript_26704/g.67296  ORF Transcript_26704/g.67296 Transcript_26704/m.67296 type:complete len:264 (+) Transcript_26704:11164-11955(+)
MRLLLHRYIPARHEIHVLERAGGCSSRWMPERCICERAGGCADAAFRRLLSRSVPRPASSIQSPSTVDAPLLLKHLHLRKHPTAHAALLLTACFIVFLFSCAKPLLLAQESILLAQSAAFRCWACAARFMRRRLLLLIRLRVNDAAVTAPCSGKAVAPALSSSSGGGCLRRCLLRRRRSRLPFCALLVSAEHPGNCSCTPNLSGELRELLLLLGVGGDSSYPTRLSEASSAGPPAISGALTIRTARSVCGSHILTKILELSQN